MGFKTIKKYNEERYGGMFLLRDDGDHADVIFMYRNIDDVLQADTHYIKSSEYTGYVHCCGIGCPACGKNIRVQSKLFIPLYNIEEGQVQFFDRNIRWEAQLQRDVLSKYSNPSEYVFRITRHGAAGDTATYYDIRACAKNTIMSYDEICAKLGISFPDYYSTICKEMSISDMTRSLNASSDVSSSNASNMSLPEYKITPRATIGVENTAVVPEPTQVVEPAPAPVETEISPVFEGMMESDDVYSDDDVTF